MENKQIKTRIDSYTQDLFFGLILMHFFFLSLFLIAKIIPLFIYHSLSDIFYIVFYFCVLKKNLHSKKSIYPFLYRCISIELKIQLIFTAVCIGFNSGFFLFGFGFLITLYTSATILWHEENIQLKLKSTQVSIILTIFLTLILSNLIEPIYPLSRKFQILLFIFNMITFYFLLTSSMDVNANYIFNWESQLSLIAQCDALTTLFNRHKMRDFFTEIHSKFLQGTYKFAITIVDIDDFKHFNDTFGHDAGDYILKEISDIFLSFSHKYKPADIFSIEVDCPDLICCRWGGEEFLFAQTYNTELKDAVSIILKIFDAVRNHTFDYKGERFSITLTGGTAEHQVGSTINKTIEAADRNLYKGKQSGKDKLIY